MSERATLARPYATAAFALAQEKKALKKWSEMLTLLAAVVRDDRMRARLDDPRIARERLAALLIEIGGKNVDKDGANFLRVLAENRRLPVLPEIAALFEERRAAAEARVEAEVVSAYEVSAAQLKKISAALEKKLGREVTLTPRVDASLLGGIVIRAGDLVIDGSVRGQLHALATHLNR